MSDFSPQKTGRMLAYLECVAQKDNILAQTARLSEADTKIVEMLKKRINDISNLEKSTPSKFPDAEEIYLYKVIDACIRHLFLVPDHAPKSKNDECNVLFREMNDEFYLFENYSDIMRGYLLGKQEFINIS